MFRAGAEVGLDAEELRRVGDVTECELADAGLRALQQVRDERGRESEVLGGAELPKLNSKPASGLAT